MTVTDWLDSAVKKLAAKAITTARLDCLVLLEDVTMHDRGWLLAHPEFELSTAMESKLEKLLKRRAAHEPLAYVRGKTEFFGREFKVSPAVLVPRPESEAMIELLKGLSNLPAKPRIADIGTGSGALGITAKLELPSASVDLVEVDDAAIEIAQNNVVFHTLGLQVIKSDLLVATSQDYDILLCNLPYVPDGYSINEAAKHEPKIALFAGIDGLDLYRRLFQQISTLSKKPLFILTESLPQQHHALATLARHYDYILTQSDDFIECFELGTIAE